MVPGQLKDSLGRSPFRVTGEGTLKSARPEKAP